MGKFLPQQRRNRAKSFAAPRRHAPAADQRQQKWAAMLPFCACLLFRQELYFAVQHGDWRRGVAALLGRFLPKLRAAFERPFFLGVLLLQHRLKICK